MSAQGEYTELFAPHRCCEYDAPSNAAETARFTSETDAWVCGMEPVSRDSNEISSGLMTALVAMFVLIALNARHCYRLFGSVGADLLNVRRRVNAFDEHTADESRTVALLVMMLCLCEGILVTGALFGDAVRTTVLPAVMGGLMGVFYLFQLAAYGVVGYVFTDKTGAASWLKGFNASQTLLGLTLLIPTFILIFYPSTGTVVLSIAVIFYFFARIAFIYKGFKVFYHKIPSLLYFILYLCALEIIPVLLVCSGAKSLGSLFVK